ncbi:hypothetical protein NKH18_27220 [Streptomyces sp. M10(2022)]
MASTGLGALTVDNDTHPQDLGSVFRVMRGGSDLVRLNVPVTGRGLATSTGSAVEVDWKPARKVFARLKEDRPVPGRPAGDGLKSERVGPGRARRGGAARRTWPTGRRTAAHHLR